MPVLVLGRPNLAMANIVVEDAVDLGLVRFGSICVQDDLPSLQMLFGHGVPFDLANSSRPWGSLCRVLGSEARKHEG